MTAECINTIQDHLGERKNLINRRLDILNEETQILTKELEGIVELETVYKKHDSYFNHIQAERAKVLPSKQATKIKYTPPTIEQYNTEPESTVKKVPLEQLRTSGNGRGAQIREAIMTYLEDQKPNSTTFQGITNWVNGVISPDVSKNSLDHALRVLIGAGHVFRLEMGVYKAL